MKFTKLLLVIVGVLVVGGVLGVRLGGSGLQADVPQLAAVAQPEAVQLQAIPQSAAPARVGLVGVLQAVGSQSLSVQTKDGLTLLTINSTAGLENGSSAFDQLKVGDKVAVWAQNVNGQTVVTKIVVVPQSPQRIHYVGLIANVSGDKLQVVGQQGETTTFRFDGTLQSLPDAARKPQVGDTVTVVAKPDPLGDGWLAVAVVRQ